MAHLYKEPKFCECGYSTKHRGLLSTHRSRHCPLRDKSSTDEHWKRQVESLEQDKKNLHEQLVAKDEQMEQMAEQLRAKDERILNLTNQLLQQANKRQKTAKRKKLSEPERREIAIRQDWNCANPDNNCCLKGKLKEYDIDHIIPLCQGGQDDPSNFQAICPACHRRKTERDLLAVVEPAEVD